MEKYDINNKMAEVLLVNDNVTQTYAKALDETIKAHIQLTESYMKTYTACMEKVFADHVKEIQDTVNKQSEMINNQQEYLNQLKQGD